MSTSLFTPVSRRVLALILFGWSTAQLPAQSAATGVITGRIFNANTGEFVRNAEVRVEGTSQQVISEDGGYYRISGVSPGQVSLSVRYTGYASASAAVNVEPGRTATRDFELTAVDRSDTVKLAAFVVSSEREGNAKAIMDQRNSMTMSMSIAADTFGQVVQGNVGEFMKYLPGVDIEYFEADAKGIRLGGMDPQYTGVSMDGMKLASADAFMQATGTDNVRNGDGLRSFGFDQVSINSIESIEVHRVTPSDMDADSPAGTINLKMKRAFDRKDRRIKWSFGGALNSEEFHLRRTPGPGDKLTRKIRPTASLDYSDVFLGGRLGILIGVSESNTYNEQLQMFTTVNRTPTATDPRPAVITALELRDGPSWSRLFTATVAADYKATENLTLSLSAVHNYNHRDVHLRRPYLQFATNNTNASTGRQTVRGDGILNVATGSSNPAAASYININYEFADKITPSYTVTPKFEYKRGSLNVDGTASFSRARNIYEDHGNVAFAGVGPLMGVGMSASRPDTSSGAWAILQTSGPDWSDLGSFLNPRTAASGQNVTNEIFNASLNAKYVLPLRAPSFLKAGAKVQSRWLKYDQPNTGLGTQQNYIGPGGGPTGSYAAFPSPFVVDLSTVGISLTSISGARAPAYVNVEEVAVFHSQHPELYVDNPNLPADPPKVYQRHRNVTEEIPAAYLLGNTRLGKLQLQAGVRWERTEVDSEEYDPLPWREVEAAGFPVNRSTGYATTEDGATYQFKTRPLAHRIGKYDNFFPSITAKYRFGEGLIADVGYTRAISRPNINRIGGLWVFNDVAATINVPNPNLTPETSERVAASLGYYFGSVSSLTLAVTETHIENLVTNTEMSAAEFGLTDPEFAEYTVFTSTTGEGKRRFRGLELSYRHHLNFLPGLLRGTSVFGTFTRTYADQRRPGLVPNVVTGGVDYHHGRFSFGIRGVWQDETPWGTANTIRFRKNNVKFDGNVGYRITHRTTLFVQARNILNENSELFEDGMLWRLENFGSQWMFGVRGEF